MALSSNNTLECKHCGKKPLLYSSDRVPVDVIRTGGIITHMKSSNGSILERSEFEAMSDLVIDDVAYQCTKCNNIVCAECVFIKNICPICGDDSKFLNKCEPPHEW